jgi:hypothetical protein
MVVENLKMVEPGSLALSLGLNRGNGVLDAIDPPTGRRVVVIDTHLAMDMTIAWQQTPNLRLHLSMSGTHIAGNAFGAFEGGGYQVGDTDFGVRWRLLNDEKLGLQFGLYSDLTFPTGDSEQLAGAGATNVQVGALLSQRFDDLTFQGALGYRHRTKSAQFADARFGNVVDYRAGLYIPLDWPHWLLFTEVAGLLNTTSSDLDGTEPAEVFGGVTFGEFTQMSLAYATGLNEEGGASARRFAMRVTHHFGAQERAMTAVVEPATTALAHFDRDRGRASKTPTSKGGSARSPAPTAINAEPSVNDSKTSVLKTEDQSSPRSQRLAVPALAKAIKPASTLSVAPRVAKPKVHQSIVPSASVDTRVSTALKKPSPQSREVTKKSTQDTTQNKATKTVKPKPAPALPTKTKTSPKAKHKAAKQAVVRPIPEQRKSKAKPLPPKLPVASMKKPAAAHTQNTFNDVYPVKRPGLHVKPMVTPRAPLSLVYNAGQTAPSNAAFNRLVGEIEVHLKATPSTTQMLVEAYAAPGERPYTPRTHTPQRDAYQLAQIRSDTVLVRLNKVFPKVRFKAAPRIWPSHVVEGNDFWSGVILTPQQGSSTQTNQIKTVTHTAQPTLSLMLTLSKAVDVDSVDVLTDGLDVVIVRVKGLNEVRKWVKVKHPAVKRALIHPSYETANSGILRVRLNGFLPINYRDLLKVSVAGKAIRVQLPALRKTAL